MRSASGHFKETFVGNLSKGLKYLTNNDKLRLVGKDTYSLFRTQLAEIEAKIAAG